MPAAALYLLFAHEEDAPSESRLPKHSEVVPERIKHFMGLLGYARARCDQLIAMRPGRRPDANYREQQCSREAYDLLKCHGIEPRSGVFTSRYGKIASLLFEGMTGIANKDLEKECKCVLAAVKPKRRRPKIVDK
jgi:hypothetical protein